MVQLLRALSTLPKDTVCFPGSFGWLSMVLTPDPEDLIPDGVLRHCTQAKYTPHKDTHT